jgi:hypothetical protein
LTEGRIVALLHRSLLALALLIATTFALAATRIGIPTNNVGGNSSLALVTWSGLLNGDNGNAIEHAEFADHTVQVLGTFGTGGTVSLQGSNDNANWVILSTFAGDPITFTAAGMAAVAENPRYVRPIVSAGDGSTDLTVILFGKRIQ